MDEPTVELFLGIVATVATLVAAWLKAKNAQAYDQGDLILKQAKDTLKIGDALATVFPDLAKPVADLKDLITQLGDGWNNTSYTTAQMLSIKSDIDAMIAEINAVVKTKAAPKATPAPA
jgi:hypothetical protein